MAITTINENGMYNLLGAMVEQAQEDIRKSEKILAKANVTEEKRIQTEEFKKDAEDFLKEMKMTFGN